jgi:hypothetical protein
MPARASTRSVASTPCSTLPAVATCRASLMACFASSAAAAAAGVARMLTSRAAATAARMTASVSASVMPVKPPILPPVLAVPGVLRRQLSYSRTGPAIRTLVPAASPAIDSPLGEPLNARGVPRSRTGDASCQRGPFHPRERPRRRGLPRLAVPAARLSQPPERSGLARLSRSTIAISDPTSTPILTCSRGGSRRRTRARRSAARQ